MKKTRKYYKGWITFPIEHSVAGYTEKALCFTVAGGYTCANDTYLWIPKSIIKFGEPNEHGNADIFIPMWFVAQHDLWKAIERIREVDFLDIVEF